MELKFKKGDIVRLKSGGENMIAIDYKINHAGGIVNFALKEKKYPESVITSQLLCEWMYKGKATRKYFEQDNLELVKPAEEQ